MWCQNCGKSRAHYHVMGSAKSRYCQRCRARSTMSDTYCRFCGERRWARNSSCDVHDGNSGSPGSLPWSLYEFYIGWLAFPTVSSDDDLPEYDDDDDDNYATDMSSPRSLSPTRSSSSVSRDERKRCDTCELWFESDDEYDDHKNENTSGCSQHKICFPISDNYQHAKDKYHEYCFVLGCDFNHADASSGYSDTEIMDHVWDEHTERGWM